MQMNRHIFIHAAVNLFIHIRNTQRCLNKAQIGDAIMEHLKPKGVMVIVQAEHMCMTMRGIKKPGSQTLTYVCRGAFEDNPALQQMVFNMVK